MEKIVDVAKYISKKYRTEKECFIDQMKLHKILFFIQKESFSRLQKEMFKEDFQGWKLGPVCTKIRYNYSFIKKFDGKVYLKDENKEIIDYIFDKYKDINSYELSRLSHLEYSWIKSRIGIQDGENGNVIISKSDIHEDALEQ